MILQAEDGYRGGLEHIEAGTRSIEEAFFTSENITKVIEHLSKPEISNPNTGEPWALNKIMIERLEAIQKGELEATATR